MMDVDSARAVSTPGSDAGGKGACERVRLAFG